MKLVRYGARGAERPGLVDASGALRDLSGVIDDITPAALAPDRLAALARIEAERLPRIDATPRLGVPVAGIGKIVCVGLNYADHVAEMGYETPAEPVLFLKATTALAGASDPIVMPEGGEKLDWEVELAAVMGRDARNVGTEAALNFVAGYALMDDVSERAFQRQRGGGTTKGKSADSFAPLGPWLATADEVGDPQELRLWTEVNGVRRQDGTTADMIFTVAELVAYVSRFMTLAAGDVLSTGSPHGSGGGMRPPLWLAPGDVVELGAGGLGRQRHSVVRYGDG